MTADIKALLDSYHVKSLEQMAEAAGLVLVKNGRKLVKVDLLQKMEDEFFTRERVEASLARLNEPERAILNRLQLRGGTASTRSFRRELVRAGLASEAPASQSAKPQRYYNRKPTSDSDYTGQPDRPNSTIFEDLITRLTFHGLVFSRDAQTFSNNGTPPKMRLQPSTTLYIPPAIQALLPQPESIPPPLADWQPAQVQLSDTEPFLRDLYLYWDFVRRNDVPMIQAGLVGKRGLKAINDSLLRPDPDLDQARREDDLHQLYRLRLLLQQLGLIRAAPDRLVLTGQDALDIPAFWHKSRIDQLKACVEAWPKLSGADLSNKDGDQYRPNFQTARKELLNALKTMPANGWLEADDLLDRIRSQDRNFLVPDRIAVENQRSRPYYTSYYSTYSGTYFYGKPEELLAKFDDFENEFVNQCLSGFLFELGLVELGFDPTGTIDQPSKASKPEGWRAFRFTPMGRAVWSRKPTMIEGEMDTGKVIVQPNFQILAIGSVGLDLLAQFDLFAEREQVDRTVFQYRLSRESVYRGQQLGFTVAEIVRLLTEVSQVELPQNVRRSLDEWAGHHNRIVFRKGLSLLQAADAGLLTSLLTKAPTKQLLARSLTETTALIQSGRQQALISGLVEQGLFPAVSGPDPESADHTVLIHPDGAIEPIHAVPSLHLQGRLAQVAEQGGDKSWRLTPASVRRAGGSRNKVLKLLEELARLQRGTLPAELAVQLKAWGGYYGSAAVETLTLIEFSDKTALDELGRHPNLQAVLTPFPVEGRSLAIVPDDQLEHIKEVLAKFGISVKEGLKY